MSLNAGANSSAKLAHPLNITLDVIKQLSIVWFVVFACMHARPMESGFGREYLPSRSVHGSTAEHYESSIEERDPKECPLTKSY
uniref:Secreted protein n=1 Tax=Ascaris lumbricoides TaxID=6252 RepID=A0A0M3I8N1_ASCLU